MDQTGATGRQSLTIPELASLASGLTLLAADGDPQLPIQTLMGPRSVGDEFETLVSELDSGWAQTTIRFLQDMLAGRQPIHDTASVSGEVFASGPV